MSQEVNNKFCNFVLHQIKGVAVFRPLTFWMPIMMGC
jgi:hypothetical protein